MYQKKVYDTLVRDKIPDIINQQGDSIRIRYIRDDKEFETRLALKLHEEIQEFVSSGMSDINKLAGVLTVLETVQRMRGWAKIDIDDAIAQKIEARGAFDDRVMLMEVIKDAKSRRDIFR